MDERLSVGTQIGLLQMYVDETARWESTACTPIGNASSRKVVKRPAIGSQIQVAGSGDFDLAQQIFQA